MGDILYESLKRYYIDDNNIDKLLKIVNNKSKISLRIIDWFVTNYSKKFNISYLIYKEKNGEKTFSDKDTEIFKQFNTYHSYKGQLKSFSKKKFDPFCRRDRLSFEYSEGKSIETTIGQLNFFKWAIDNMIIEYIEDSYQSIEEDMNISYTMIKKSKHLSHERKKRQELSKSASRGLNTHKMKVVLDFN